MPTKLSEAQENIKRFIHEARTCAEYKDEKGELGFAAMSGSRQRVS